MKAISILQPWATLIAVGAKRIETRSWATKYRGPLAIHASKGLPKEGIPVIAVTEAQRLAKADRFLDLPRGVVIATCNMVDCIQIGDEFPGTISDQEYAFGDYEYGRYAWILEDVRPLPEPVPAKGMLGLWNWEPPPGVL